MMEGNKLEKVQPGLLDVVVRSSRLTVSMTYISPKIKETTTYEEKIEL
jgi:hypothetical protein